MPTLYVTEPGSRIEKEGQRILVSGKDDEVLMRVPLRQVSEVVLVGWVGVTTPSMLSLLNAGVSLSLVTRSGRLRGRLQAPQARNLPLRRLQYARGEEKAFCLAVSRAIVQGKLANCRTMAMRILRNLDPEQKKAHPNLRSRLSYLTEMLEAVPEATSLEVLRGLEGNGTRAYFAILRAGLKWQGEAAFKKRTRRPPRDPVNALLSFGYTLLGEALFTAAEVVGLDPYAGFFHVDQYSRPALALDLVEEFRPVVVDSVVLTLVNKRMVTPQDFRTSKDGGIYLVRRSLPVFFRQFTRRLNTLISHPEAGRSISYQKCFEVQARQLRSCIEGKKDSYQPFLVK